MNSLKILKTFLNELDINESYLDLIAENVKYVHTTFSDISEFDTFDVSIIYKILVDSYCLNSEQVKNASNNFTKTYGAIGREHKNLIKKYYDYNDKNAIEELFSLLRDTGCCVSFSDLKNLLDKYYVNNEQLAVTQFKTNWDIAVNCNDEKKLRNYLMGIFTALIHIVDLSHISLAEIYDYNSNYFDNSLSTGSLNALKDFCYSDKSYDTIGTQADKFQKFFSHLHSKDNLIRLGNGEEGVELQQKVFDNSAIQNNSIFAFSTTATEYFETESYSLVVLRLTQDIYNKFETTNDFFDYVLGTIKSSYRVLENYRVFSVIIENIFDKDGKNLKWILYSIIGIYAEHFIPRKCINNFYHPEKLCFEYLNYAGLVNDEACIKILAKYYSGAFSIEQVSEILNISEDNLIKIGKINELKDVWYGFTFQDCICLRRQNKQRQNCELDFIGNDSDLLFVFSKYRPDEYKIPCPECGGLNVSGNSYPEIGHRSWECKNVICPSRSKSNRGKRYSYKSNFMQSGAINRSSYNIISSEFIKTWHRDIVSINDDETVLEMLIRYFSFENEKVLFINDMSNTQALVKKLNRKIYAISAINEGYTLSPANISYLGIYEDYFVNGKYIKRYTLNDKTPVSIDEKINSAVLTQKALLINGDCCTVLSKIEDNTIDGAVTSPPYYNARAYSQWANYYLYWSDMYDIIRQCYRVMKPGTTFLYNIGDICGNENTVACSTMGNKRLLLGAYTIDLFLRAGFELVDNILWDKGEPQSNRQKNDGKFTPFYQRPLNCYEHMFLFKKPGADLITSPKSMPIEWKNNVVKFSPVIKINSKGENTVGHTAPFPKDIPAFLSKTFTNSKDSVVLDPFSGSLTSVIASNEAGVRGFGIEMCPEYVELSKERARKEGITLTVI